MTKIYIASCGTGKTWFCQHNAGWIDLDSYLLKYVSNDMQFLIKAIKYYRYWGYNILTNASAVKALLEAGIHIDGIIIPSPQMNDEILNRLKQRQDGDFWKYNQLPSICEFSPEVPTIRLKPGQYISDVLDSEGNIKNGVNY